MTDKIETTTLASVTAQNPTGLLRWVPLSSAQAHRRKLQQEWHIWTYQNGNLIGDQPRAEWRDVPFVSDAE